MKAIAIEFQTGNAHSNSKLIAEWNEASRPLDAKQPIDILRWAMQQHQATLAMANASGLEGVTQIRMLATGSEKHELDSEIDYCI